MTEGLGPQIDFPPEPVVPESGPKRERVRKARPVKQKSLQKSLQKSGAKPKPKAAFTGPRKPRPKYAREPQEHYVEEMWVSRRLFETRDFGGVIVDPCAGFGSILMSAMAMGLRAWGSDLVARAPWIAGGHDFLSPGWRAPRGLGRFAIVGNPPFGGRTPLIRQFAETALTRADQVALLVPVARLAAAGEWLQGLPLVEIVHVSPRSSLWPGRLYAERLKKGLPLRNGFADACWLIFDARAPAGPAKTSWLRRQA